MKYRNLIWSQTIALKGFGLQLFYFVGIDVFLLYFVSTFLLTYDFFSMLFHFYSSTDDINYFNFKDTKLTSLFRSFLLPD